MSDLVVLRYTEETPLELVHAAFINLKKAVPDKTIIAIPYSIDILEDCSLEQLYEIKTIIDKVIEERSKEWNKI